MNIDVDRFISDSNSFSMGQDEMPYPLHTIGILGPNAVVFETNLLMHPVKQTHGFLIATYHAHTIPKKLAPSGLFRGLSMAYDAASGSITSVIGLIPQARR
ncbi:MAG: hypothetical protein AB3X41_04605 [Leptothrix ochracea]|uniref:hypothetical protein n=1 Tax=Leptothrix ochracea TaxID=735331 RepID=UPI0034E29C6F